MHRKGAAHLFVQLALVGTHTAMRTLQVPPATVTHLLKARNLSSQSLPATALECSEQMASQLQTRKSTSHALVML